MDPDQQREILKQAARRLARSERGIATMTALDGFLRGPARSLDNDSRQALFALLHGLYCSFPGTTLELLEEYTDSSHDAQNDQETA